jgi:acetyl-CoA carboxylase carboxyltransferase component
MLLDEGSYFLEIAPLAGHGMENEFIGVGVVGGVGLVSGRQCLIIANEATVKGGAVSEIGQRKNARLAEIAATNHLATITLVESAGADLPVQHKIFVPGGAGFKEITRRSKYFSRLRQFDGGRRLSAWNVRLRRDGEESSEGISRRAAAGQDGHGRSG